MKGNRAEFWAKMSRGINKFGLRVKKHSPEIFIVTGVCGVVASTIMACRATTKLGGILEEKNNQLDDIEHYKEHPEDLGEDVEYTKEDAQKDEMIIRAGTAVKIVKIYLPAVLTGVASISAIVASHQILSKRNAAISMAYMGVNNAFKSYRKRVVDRFGEDLDKELRFNIKAADAQNKKDAEDGAVQETSTGALVNANDLSEFAKIFDAGNPGWEDDPEQNLMYLRKQQMYANNLLQTRGHLFLNEVYDMLGFPRTKAGNIVGWIYDKKNPAGDNYVDFGIYDLQNPACHRFVNGYEPSILLDFNIDGPILDSI